MAPPSLTLPLTTFTSVCLTFTLTHEETNSVCLPVSVSHPVLLGFLGGSVSAAGLTPRPRMQIVRLLYFLKYEEICFLCPLIAAESIKRTV